MPELSITPSDRERKETVVTVDYGKGTQAFLWPDSPDRLISGSETLKYAAAQHNITVSELLDKLKAGETVHFKNSSGRAR
jgi:hypothetical protein